MKKIILLACASALYSQGLYSADQGSAAGIASHFLWAAQRPQGGDHRAAKRFARQKKIDQWVEEALRRNRSAYWETFGEEMSPSLRKCMEPFLKSGHLQIDARSLQELVMEHPDLANLVSSMSIILPPVNNQSQEAARVETLMKNDTVLWSNLIKLSLNGMGLRTFPAWIKRLPALVAVDLNNNPWLRIPLDFVLDRVLLYFSIHGKVYTNVRNLGELEESAAAFISPAPTVASAASTEEALLDEGRRSKRPRSPAVEEVDVLLKDVEP